MSEMLALVASSLAWALLDFVWQGVLVAWVAAIVLVLMRGARPQARYAVACAALLLCAACDQPAPKCNVGHVPLGVIRMTAAPPQTRTGGPTVRRRTVSSSAGAQG